MTVPGGPSSAALRHRQVMGQACPSRQSGRLACPSIVAARTPSRPADPEPRFHENEMAAQVSEDTTLTRGERLIGMWLALSADRATRQTVAPISRLIALTGEWAGYVSEALEKLSGECGHFL